MAEPGSTFSDAEATTNLIPRDSAIQALNTIIQLHFEKTLEKKHSIDLQKKHLHKLLHLSLLLLSLLQPRLHCRHCWLPLSLLTLSFFTFYVSVAQSLRCLNGFKYQRRCHKLTLALATERLRSLKRAAEEEAMLPAELEICYQEPPESYLAKFRMSWVLYFGFLLLVFGVMVCGSVVVLCY